MSFSLYTGWSSEQRAAENPNIQFILAVEEPEAFLHPQKQKKFYQNVRAAQSENLGIIVTTHSPYIVAETPFTGLGLVRKDGTHSALHVPDVKTARDGETFDAYSSEVNNLLFFADKVVLVEGESDQRARASAPTRCSPSIVSPKPPLDCLVSRSRQGSHGTPKASALSLPHLISSSTSSTARLGSTSA